MTVIDLPTPSSTEDLSAQGATGGITRWRLAARLARREIRRRPWRTALVVLLIAVPVTGMMMLSIGYRTNRLPYIGPQGNAVARFELNGLSTRFGDSDVARLVPDGVTFTWWSLASLPLRNAAHPDVLVTDVSVLQSPMTDPLIGDIVRVDHGRSPVRADEVALTKDAGAAFGVSIGDELVLVRPPQRFQVVGIVTVEATSRALVAPGFDLSVINENYRSAVVLAGRHGDPGDEAALAGVSELNGSSIPNLTNAQWGTVFERDRAAPTADGTAIFFGWLGGTLAMGAFGIVVAATFAISGRRQLVTVGQLSATGADPAIMRRFLALQGTWAGAIGAVTGLAGTALVIGLAGGLFRSNGRLEVSVFDIAVISFTAIVVATVAALLPARTLASMSTLTALGGRRPVTAVSARQIRNGAVLTVGALIVLPLTVVADRNANGGGTNKTLPLLLAMLASVALLAGVCCLTPAAVSLLARLGRRCSGSLRLAVRDLDRHRARSGALIAAIAVLGATVTVAGATVEQRDHDVFQSAMSNPPDRIIQIRAWNSTGDRPADPAAVRPTLRNEIEAIVGPVDIAPIRLVSWKVTGSDDPSSATGGPTYAFGGATVIDPVLLSIIGMDPADIERIVDFDGITLVRRDFVSLSAGSAYNIDAQLIATEIGPPVRPSDVLILDRPRRGFGPSLYISNRLVEQLHLVPVVDELIARADHEPTAAEAEALGRIGNDPEEWAFIEFADPSMRQLSVNASGSYYYRLSDHRWTTVYRWSILGAALALVMLVVGLGMALWAAEGREDRATLTALGARPFTLALLAGWKAWLLSFIGGLIAIPLGFGTLRLCIAAANQHTRFPWVVAGGLLVAIPLIVAGFEMLVDAVTQRVRPVRATTSSID